VRSDPNLDPEARERRRWAGPALRRWSRDSVAGIAVGLSGNERNHLFLNQRGRRFEDVSPVSGLDSKADSRGFAIFDYDRDGFSDVAFVNTNAPFFELHRNEIGHQGGRGGALALRFAGGNRSAAPSTAFSARDGYGAVVSVRAGGLELVREHRAGEGFAAQNSAALLVGIGGSSRAELVRVRWPSGRVQERRDVPAGSLLRVFEDPAESPDGSGFALEPYVKSPADPPAARAARAGDGDRLALAPEGTARLRLYTTTATWCPSCKKSLARLSLLRAAFAADELDLYGVPVDPEDTPEKLRAYREQYRPAYEQLVELTPAEVGAVRERVRAALGDDQVLPASIVTDSGGRVLATLAGVPTVSQLRRLAAAAGS
jgi:thiol-disulfide isomerase/thioredoxin